MLRRGYRGGLLVLLLCLVGCSSSNEESSTQIFAMNTIMSLSAQGEQSQARLDEGVAQIYDLERTLSVTDEHSDIWAINHAQGEWVAVSHHTLSMIDRALQLAEVTDGAIDPTIYPAMLAWGFTTGDYHLPSQETLDDILPLIDYTAIEIDQASGSIRIPQGMQLDLGAIAKGYTSDLVAEILCDMDSAILNLGGNAYVIGEKEDGSSWRVGIQNPEDDGYLAVISPQGGNAVITSGGYQRYFEEDGQTYWHILDPDTACPADSDLRSVTVIGDDGALCDGLSTALFVMGLEQSCQFWQDNLDLAFDFVLVDDQGGIYVTESIYDGFTLADGVNNPVEVIIP